MRQGRLTGSLTVGFLKWLRVLVLVFTSCLWGCTGSKSDDDDTIKPKGDEFISGFINGKELIGSDPVTSYEDYGTGSYNLDMSGILEISPSEGYLISITVKKPKVGTLSSKTGAVSGEISYIAGTILSPVVREYALTSALESTVTFTALNSPGYAEGTLSLTARASDGKTLNLTNGKFRIKL
ncbi:hypothetical protein [Spirosoma sp.]|uniref:hypothetical protein n=1 Tax=Spirosoma sp. TaxID=1899569 RepID=UPI002613D34B|nr:hypothetical protein [Spirosoma sp.]MCX6214606.1 hypothetical protein [Spirosoma sp.]